MNNSTRQNFESFFFTYFTLFWMLLGWLGFLLALTGIFYTWIFILYFVSGMSFLLYFIYSKKFFSKLSNEFKSVGLISLLIVIIFSFFATPTIFSGRDQGSFSEAAIRLEQNHQLKFSTPISEEFFKIYSAPKEKFSDCLKENKINANSMTSNLNNFWCQINASGRALNFPGFHYLADGNLITQFPIPYIAWLAIFYSLFGLVGLLVANAVLFYIFLLSFYFIGKIFLEKWGRPALFLTIIFSFSFSWFLKFTLSENMALALIWFGILQLLLFIKNKTVSFYFSAFFTFSLLAFTRIEGLAIFIMFFLILIFHKNSRRFLVADLTKKIYLPLLFVAGVFILTLAINYPFFKEAGKALLKNPGLISNNDSLSTTLGIFHVYGILPFAILGSMGIVYFLKNKNYLALVPLFTLLPVFFYLLNPHISQDHPWLLRRFVFAILPAFIFYSVFWLTVTMKNKHKYFFLAIIFFLLTLNIPSLAKYFIFSENQNLLAETAQLSQKFSNNDLVLVDRLASGNGFAMLTGPLNFLFEKQAVYFFNPDDFHKLETFRFEKIYLLTPAANVEYYENSSLGKYLKNSADYSIITKRLDLTKSSLILPEIKEVRITGKIFEINKR